jgi:hypothetical protein
VQSRPPCWRPGTSVKPEQQGTTQAHPTIGRSLHRRRGVEAWDLQAFK